MPLLQRRELLQRQRVDLAQPASSRSARRAAASAPARRRCGSGSSTAGAAASRRSAARARLGAVLGHQGGRLDAELLQRGSPAASAAAAARRGRPRCRAPVGQPVQLGGQLADPGADRLQLGLRAPLRGRRRPRSGGPAPVQRRSAASTAHRAPSATARATRGLRVARRGGARPRARGRRARRRGRRRATRPGRASARSPLLARSGPRAGPPSRPARRGATSASVLAGRRCCGSSGSIGIVQLLGLGELGAELLQPGQVLLGRLARPRRRRHRAARPPPRRGAGRAGRARPSSAGDRGRGRVDLVPRGQRRARPPAGASCLGLGAPPPARGPRSSQRSSAAASPAAASSTRGPHLEQARRRGRRRPRPVGPEQVTVPGDGPEPGWSRQRTGGRSRSATRRRAQQPGRGRRQLVGRAAPASSGPAGPGRAAARAGRARGAGAGRRDDEAGRPGAVGGAGWPGCSAAASRPATATASAAAPSAAAMATSYARGHPSRAANGPSTPPSLAGRRAAPRRRPAAPSGRAQGFRARLPARRGRVRLLRSACGEPWRRSVASASVGGGAASCAAASPRRSSSRPADLVLAAPVELGAAATVARSRGLGRGERAAGRSRLPRGHGAAAPRRPGRRSRASPPGRSAAARGAQRPGGLGRGELPLGRGALGDGPASRSRPAVSRSSRSPLLAADPLGLGVELVGVAAGRVSGSAAAAAAVPLGGQVRRRCGAARSARTARYQVSWARGQHGEAAAAACAPASSSLRPGLRPAPPPRRPAGAQRRPRRRRPARRASRERDQVVGEQPQPRVAQLGLDHRGPAGHLGLPAQRLELAAQLGGEVGRAGSRLACIASSLRSAFSLRLRCLRTPAASSMKARRSSGRRVQDGVELALPDDHVHLAADAGVGQQLLDVEQPAAVAVDRVLALAGPEHQPA